MEPGTKLSKHTTSCPILIKQSQRWLPRNPAPPVIKTRMIAPLSSFDERVAVPEALIPFGPPPFHSAPSPLQPVASRWPSALAAKVRQGMSRIRAGFGALDGALRDHPEVVDQGRLRHGRRDPSLSRLPAEVALLASNVQ